MSHAGLRASLADRLSQAEADHRLRQAAAQAKFKELADRATEGMDPETPIVAAAEPPPTPTQGEQQDAMGKEDTADKPLRDYTEAERRALLEATRGLGDKALTEAAKKLPVSRTTIYMWRKELWGTMNAHGVVTDKARAKPKVEEAEAPDTGKKGRVRRLTPEQWKAHVAAADASGNHAKYERDHGLSAAQISKWRQQLGGTRGAPGKPPTGSASKYTLAQRERMARAAVASGNVAKWAAESRLPQTTVAAWVKKLGLGTGAPRAPRSPDGTRALVKAGHRELQPASDAELIDGYEQTRALAKAAREPAARLAQENARLKKLIVVLKANLAYAIENGLVEHLTIDLMFKKGDE